MTKAKNHFVLIVGYFIAILFFLFNVLSVSAQSFESLFQQGLRLEREMNEKAALIKYREAQKLKPLDLKVLCKCSDLSGSIGNKEKNSSIRNKYFETSLSFAKIACNNYPKSDESNVSLSIAMGRIALTKSGKDKIEFVKGIKVYADRAVSINPNNFIAWHVLGKWYYEISNLNFIEKTAVKLFFGSLPEASFQESIKAFEKAKSLSNGFMQNYLELARVYIKTGQDSLALTNLNQLIQFSPSSEDDKISIIEAHKLLESLRGS